MLSTLGKDAKAQGAFAYIPKVCMVPGVGGQNTGVIFTENNTEALGKTHCTSPAYGLGISIKGRHPSRVCLVKSR